MTTDLIARLNATISIEEPASRELTALLDQAAQLLYEDADARDQAADNAEPNAKTRDDHRHISDLRSEAWDRKLAASDLGTWIGQLNAALLLPPDQRQALA